MKHTAEDETKWIQTAECRLQIRRWRALLQDISGMMRMEPAWLPASFTGRGRRSWKLSWMPGIRPKILIIRNWWVKCTADLSKSLEKTGRTIRLMMISCGWRLPVREPIRHFTKRFICSRQRSISIWFLTAHGATIWAEACSGESKIRRKTPASTVLQWLQRAFCIRSPKIRAIWIAQLQSMTGK